METTENNRAEPETITQMELRLSQVEHELRDSYCELGKSILELAEAEGRRVNDMVDQIIRLRQRLAQARREVACPRCAALTDQSGLYCKHCGQSPRD